jgi:hypothetical protein
MTWQFFDLYNLRRFYHVHQKIPATFETSAPVSNFPRNLYAGISAQMKGIPRKGNHRCWILFIIYDEGFERGKSRTIDIHERNLVTFVTNREVKNEQHQNRPGLSAN